MKRICLWLIAALTIALLAGCYDSRPNAAAVESSEVDRQNEVYNRSQKPPFFEWSLARQLWIDFYNAQNQAVTTWSFIQPITGGRPLFETASQGYPIPMDTQLTNPLTLTGRWDGANGYTGPDRWHWLEGVVEQQEPNGLFPSKNTDATIVMAANGDGTLSPIYTEHKVTAFPFPVRWVGDHFERVEGEPTIKLTIKPKPAGTTPAAPATSTAPTTTPAPAPAPAESLK